jgi:hypothetical protein
MDAPSNEDEIEVVDGVPVPAVTPGPAGEIEPVRPAAPLVVVKQAAAVAATSFVAGAATIAVARVAQGQRRKRRARKRGELVKVVASRSFLVDVHLLSPRD